MIRDAVLQAAGLLSLELGGPGVYPPQPEGITEVTFGQPKWEASQGADRYRRSLYTFRKRTALFAMYETFDAPDGTACVAQRQVSNTPLQALTLLNDEMFFEAAQALGALAAKQPGDERAKAAFALRRVLTREPTDEQIDDVVAFANRQRERLIQGELTAELLTASSAADWIEGAVWTTVARALFCLDETVTRN